MMNFWYDADGRPISIHEADALLRSPARRVAFDDLGCIVISTVHTVVDLSLGDSVPLIYETLMMSSDGSDNYEQTWRTPTRAAALAAHDQAVAYARDLMKVAARNEQEEEQ